MVSINNTSNSLAVQQQLLESGSQLDRARERVASGLRINSSADDAAGQAIATRLSSQSRGLQTVLANIADTRSLGQVVDGALASAGDISQRIGELSLQSLNGTLSDRDRSAIQAEVGQLQDQLKQQFRDTQFNGRSLLDGSYIAEVTTDENGGGFNLPEIDLSAQLQTLLSGNASSAEGATELLEATRNFGEAAFALRADFGAVSSRLDSAQASLSNSIINAESSRSRIQDADTAAELTLSTAASIRKQASLALLAQSNADRSVVLKLLS